MHAQRVTGPLPLRGFGKCSPNRRSDLGRHGVRHAWRSTRYTRVVLCSTKPSGGFQSGQDRVDLSAAEVGLLHEAVPVLRFSEIVEEDAQHRLHVGCYSYSVLGHMSILQSFLHSGMGRDQQSDVQRNRCGPGGELERWGADHRFVGREAKTPRSDVDRRQAGRDTLSRFVLRARRVQAHSLVADWDNLLQQAHGGFDGHLDMAGKMTMTRRLPKDEEVFESLASRVRPLTVKSEPVYYVKVFDALSELLGEVDGGLRSRIEALRAAWDDAEIQGTQIQAYALQSARLDGSSATPRVSDTQLAAAWLYADLVHADAQGAKKEALAFSMSERYAAAVRVFSHMAALTVTTLDLIASLRADGLLTVDPEAWDDKVVVGVTELTEEGRIFVASEVEDLPDLRESISLSDNWSAFTVTDLLRQAPANRVRVVLRDESGEALMPFDAAVVRRNRESDSLEWDVLVAGSTVFKFAFEQRDGQLTAARYIGWDTIETSNELKLASTRFMLKVHDASALTFEIGEHRLMQLDAPSFSDDMTKELLVIEETVADIVAVEHMIEQVFDPCIGKFFDTDRVFLRRVRLMMEGHLVHSALGSVSVTAPLGKPPQVLIAAPDTRNVGGAEVPLPQYVMRHPHMSIEEVSSDTANNTSSYKIEPPSGDRFSMWIPAVCRVQGDQDLENVARLNLNGIDEEKIDY